MWFSAFTILAITAFKQGMVLTIDVILSTWFAAWANCILYISKNWIKLTIVFYYVAAPNATSKVDCWPITCVFEKIWCFHYQSPRLTTISIFPKLYNIYSPVSNQRTYIIKLLLIFWKCSVLISYDGTFASNWI